MGGFFERVRDPRRLQPCDVVVFPGAGRLSLTVNGWSKTGRLSVGETSRADNYASTVKRLLANKGSEARAFLVKSCDYISSRNRNAEFASLLGLGATSVNEDAETVPICRLTTLVPFRLPAWASSFWKASDWAGAWNMACGNAVSRLLADRIGAKGWIDKESRESEDRFAEACRTSPLDDQCPDVPERSPYGNHAADHPFTDCYELFEKNAYSGDKHLVFRTAALDAAEGRGMYALRPSPEAKTALTAEVYAGACAELAKRFAGRMAYMKKFLEGLAGDIRRDRGRSLLYSREARNTKTYRVSAAAFAKVEGGTWL